MKVNLPVPQPAVAVQPPYLEHLFDKLAVEVAEELVQRISHERRLVAGRHFVGEPDDDAGLSVGQTECHQLVEVASAILEVGGGELISMGQVELDDDRVAIPRGPCGPSNALEVDRSFIDNKI